MSFGQEGEALTRNRVLLRLDERRLRIFPSRQSVVTAMAFSEVDLKRIEQAVGVFCSKRSSVHLKDKLRLEYAVKGHEVVIAERRPRWDNQTEWTETPVAKLKFIRSANKWRLYWMRADLKWPNILDNRRALALVTSCKNRVDPLACFFG